MKYIILDAELARQFKRNLLPKVYFYSIELAVTVFFTRLIKIFADSCDGIIYYVSGFPGSSFYHIAKITIIVEKY